MMKRLYFTVFKYLRHRALKRRRPTRLTDPRKILLVELNSIGDTVIASYAHRALRRSFPQAQIDVLTADISRCLFEDAAGTGHVMASGLSPAAALSMARRLKAREYDLAINVTPAFKNLFFTYAADAEHMAGFLDFHTGQTGFAQTMPITATASSASFECLPDESMLLGVARILLLVSATGPDPVAETKRLLDEIPVVTAGPRKKQICVSFLSKTGFKNMPPRLLFPLVEYLTTEWPGHTAFSLVTANEQQHWSRSGMVPAGLELRVAGPIQESIREIAGSALFVGVDSGQLHLAQLTDVPIVAIFGPTRASHALYRRDGASAFEGPRTCDVETLEACARDGCAQEADCWPSSCQPVCEHIKGMLSGDMQL